MELVSLTGDYTLLKKDLCGGQIVFGRGRYFRLPKNAYTPSCMVTASIARMN